MQGKYRKIMVPVKRESETYVFWKRETAEPVCYVESYKEKRAVFFHGRNLHPEGKYHLILIGSSDGRVLHVDFGPLRTGGNGELQCYRTFDGAELEAYRFCLLCAEREDKEMDIVYKGELFQGESRWEDLCHPEKMIEAFSTGCDETRAQWFRVENFDGMSPDTERCLPWMQKYGHYIIGRKETQYYIGVPGRFLQREQPLREEGIFLLWQPMRGGEAFFERPDLMTTKQQEEIFGYWIAEIDTESDSLAAL
ncbi:MAG: hypothetical protein IKI99_06560 [Firmicutes bacterium]|nr:hypothetical protein [Bacillota bacterium]